MKKKIFLHVGHFKTGTTALQVFMARNAARFRSVGLHYAECRRKNAKHSALAFSLYRAVGVRTLMHGYVDDTPPDAIWREFFDEVRSRPEAAVLLSSEEFMRLGAWPEATELLRKIIAPASEEFDFRVIAYLRPPQDHLRSWYNQLVKMRQKVGDFESAVLAAMEPVHLDYALAMGPFFDIFGAEAVTLRRYDGALRADNRLFTDFLDTLQVSSPEGLVWPEADPNPRLDERVLEIVRLAQNAGMPPPRVNALKERASAYFDAEAAFLPAAGDDDLDAVAGRARRGIEALAEIKGDMFDPAPMLAGLPRPQDTTPGKTDALLGFILHEQVML